MGAHTNHGDAFIHLDVHTIVHCSKCGDVRTIRYPLNSREQDEAIREHAQKHGGLAR
jgi:hypothetical protein